MGIEALEEKFQRYRSLHPENLQLLADLAEASCRAQRRIRELMDEVTQTLCPSCAASCCMCMPVDGWFTESDYFLYRMLREPPLDLRLEQSGRSCTFLGPRGCRLPGDMRSFPCVKVNCRPVADALAGAGLLEEFNRLSDELGSIQEALWPLLSEHLSPTVMQAQQL